MSVPAGQDIANLLAQAQINGGRSTSAPNPSSAAPNSSSTSIAYTKPQANPLATTPITQRDRFDLIKTRPPLPQTTWWKRFKQGVFQRKNHKLFKQTIRNYLPMASTQKQQEWVQTLHVLHEKLPSKSQQTFKRLLQNGVLTDTRSENQQPTFYHLYAMANSPRINGVDGQRLVTDMLRILDKPYTITQKFAPMASDIKKATIKEFNTLSKFNNRSELPETYTGIVPSDLGKAFSATCVPSSQMYRMAENNPSELCRQINELSAMGYFWETAHRDEIWPNEPNRAEEALAEWRSDYIQTGPDSFKVKVQIPYSGRLRAINSGMSNKPGVVQSPAESLYQSALSNFGTGKRYNDLLGVRWDKFNTIMPGLNDMEKSFMESVIEDKGPIQSVSYQVTSSKANVKEGETPDGYLFGYTNSFESTTNHVLQGLKQGWAPIVGITYTDSTGKLQGGHEVTIVGAYNDEKTNELMFVVVDSDDGIPKPVVHDAKSFVPQIHHMGFPKSIATHIRKEMEPNVGLYFTPDANDAKNFNLVGYTKDQPHPEWVYWTWQIPMPEEQVEPDSQRGNQPGVNTPVPSDKTVLPDRKNDVQAIPQKDPTSPFSVPVDDTVTYEEVTPSPINATQTRQAGTIQPTPETLYQEFQIPPSKNNVYVPLRPGSYTPNYAPYPTIQNQWQGVTPVHTPYVPGGQVVTSTPGYYPELPAQPIQWDMPSVPYVGASPIHQYPTYQPIGAIPMPPPLPRPELFYPQYAN